MKNLINYIYENSELDELYDEVELTLDKFGNTQHGFKMSDKQDIIDAMYQLGFDYDDESDNDECMSFVGDYINGKYEVDLYIARQSGEKVKLRNFEVTEI